MSSLSAPLSLLLRLCSVVVFGLRLVSSRLIVSKASSSALGPRFVALVLVGLGWFDFLYSDGSSFVFLGLGGLTVL